MHVQLVLPIGVVNICLTIVVAILSEHTQVHLVVQASGSFPE